MSLRTVRNPHMKKSVVIIANALLLVERGADAVVAVAELCTLVIAIGQTWTSSKWFRKTYIFTMNPAKKSFFYKEVAELARRRSSLKSIRRSQNARKWPAVFRLARIGERDNYLAVRVPNRPCAS